MSGFSRTLGRESPAHAGWVGPPLRGAEKRSGSAVLTVAASARVIRAPDGHRLGNEITRRPGTKPRRRRSAAAPNRFSAARIAPLRVGPTRPARPGGRGLVVVGLVVCLHRFDRSTVVSGFSRTLGRESPAHAGWVAPRFAPLRAGRPEQHAPAAAASLSGSSLFCSASAGPHCLQPPHARRRQLLWG